jgi:hypothetical protein
MSIHNRKNCEETVMSHWGTTNARVSTTAAIAPLPRPRSRHGSRERARGGVEHANIDVERVVAVVDDGSKWRGWGDDRHDAVNAR